MKQAQLVGVHLSSTMKHGKVSNVALYIGPNGIVFYSVITLIECYLLVVYLISLQCFNFIRIKVSIRE